MTTSAPIASLSCALALIVGCGQTHGPTPNAARPDGGGPDGGTCEGAITWLDEAPIVRGRTRYVQPALAGDHDGFLLVTSERRPDVCEDAPCVIVERLPARGTSSTIATVPLRSTSEHMALFAGSDASGAGHFAVARATEPDELVWGSAPPWTDEPDRLALDSSRGLGAVAFEADALWILDHEWRVDGGVGEGHVYPIAPRVFRVEDGASAVVSWPDPTEGGLFSRPALFPSEHGHWSLAYALFGGPLRAAGPGWHGPLRVSERPAGVEYAAVTTRDGSLVIADYDGEEVTVTRLRPDGTRDLGPSLGAGYRGLSLATDGERFVMAHDAGDGAVQLTVLDASLAIVATETSAGDLEAHLLIHLDVAAASDGTFALLSTFYASGSDLAIEPVALRRFRACE